MVKDPYDNVTPVIAHITVPDLTLRDGVLDRTREEYFSYFALLLILMLCYFAAQSMSETFENNEMAISRRPAGNAADKRTRRPRVFGRAIIVVENLIGYRFVFQGLRSLE